MEKISGKNTDVLLLKALTRIVNVPGPEKSIRRVMLDTIEMLENLGILNEEELAEAKIGKDEIRKADELVLKVIWTEIEMADKEVIIGNSFGFRDKPEIVEAKVDIGKLNEEWQAFQVEKIEGENALDMIKRFVGHKSAQAELAEQSDFIKKMRDLISRFKKFVLSW